MTLGKRVRRGSHTIGEMSKNARPTVNMSTASDLWCHDAIQFIQADRTVYILVRDVLNLKVSQFI